MKKTNMPKVSVVVATYNRAQELASTIENIFDQDYGALELVVVNDGSSDQTLSTLEKLKTKFSFVLVNNPVNLGLQKALNIGIHHASGKYIARIDDHDKWSDKEKLSKQVIFLESNPNVGVVGTAYKVGEKEMQNPLSDAEIRKQILMRSPFCHVSVLMPKSIVNQVGGYNENLSYSEDWELWLKIGKYAQLANLPDITVEIRKEEHSLSNDYFLKQLPINRQIVKRFYKDYPFKIKAYLYHQLIKFFFAIFSVNGSMHKVMKRVFLEYFTLSTHNNSVND